MAGSLTLNTFIFACSALLNWSFTFLIFSLRYRSENAPMTYSQRWGLSILGFIFLMNAIYISFYFTAVVLTGPGRTYDLFLVARIQTDLDVMTSFLLLGFGLVYPRLFVSWNRLIMILGVVATFAIMTILLESLVLFPQGTSFVFGSPLMMIYAVGCFVPIFLWLPEYDRQNSPQMRMTLTLLIWGYLFLHVTRAVSSSIWQLWVGWAKINAEMLSVTVLVLIVFILIGRALYFRRGRWTNAEWAHIVFIAISLSLGLVMMFGFDGALISVTDDSGPLYTIVYFLCQSAGWMIVRPMLFSYGLLRFQMFGSEVKAGSDIILFLTIIMSGSVALAIIFMGSGIDPVLVTVLGLAVGAVLFYPFRMVSTKMVAWLLPMSAGIEHISLKERRITYLLGLQTAVFEGRIDEEDDERSLQDLRRSLRISDREHDLLMHGFARERPPSEVEAIEEIYLFDKGGVLLSSASLRKKSDKKDMVASMFTAVREFSKDALAKGKVDVDAIEYGERTLIIEVEKDSAVGVVLRGKDNPQVRQRLRDLLRDMDKLNAFSADGRGVDGTKGAPYDMLLNEFLKGGASDGRT
jgi:hypothetical protein